MVQGDALFADLTLTNISLSDYLWNNSVDDNTKNTSYWLMEYM